MFQLDKIIYINRSVERKSSQIQQNEIPILTGMQKPSKGLKIPKWLHWMIHLKLMKN